MYLHHLARAAAAVAVLALPTAALAAPDQNTTNGQYNNQCVQWNNNGQCVRWNTTNNGNGQWNNNGNGQWNNNGNGQWNDNGRHRHHNDGDDNRGNRNNGDRDDHHGNRNNGDRDDNNQNNGNHYGWGRGNGNNGYGNNGYGNGNSLSGVVSSFSPYNLYLQNGTHVVLHNGTVIRPTGANLTNGQRVRVIGYRNGDGTFAANEIDVSTGYNR